MESLGYRRAVCQFDDAHSILALLRALKLTWTSNVITETSAKGDPQSNGGAELAVNAVKGRLRAAKAALEESIGEPVPDDHAILTCVVLAAVRRYTLGRDGKTSYGRRLGW